ncbi:MAG: hypothetical protein J3K34DRAFT_524121 [Monoraphidium minutum]|nr:MAG: hypothetical protein J3K34DRAFT_524121 [Monoraphidium minutum]
MCTSGSGGGEGARWGLLLPICYRGEASQGAVWSRLAGFVDSLAATTVPEERALLRMHVGVDQFDVVFDDDGALAEISRMFAALGVPVTFTLLRSHFRHKICWIWGELARAAVDEGAELFVLLGDDVRLLTQGWKAEIEAEFAALAAARRLPPGAACVAFRDASYPVFPTFPVMHRRHLDVFGDLFPRQLINQHGDPFLFELYRRWGASVFAPTAALVNTVGGGGGARYQKHGAHWRDGLLSAAIEGLAASLDPATPRYRCLNVVVPTYRCDPAALARFAALRASPEARASVHILVVVDDPASPQLPRLGPLLEDYSPNRLVRVAAQPANGGASRARNAGMAQSFGDWTVLLDDDVIPSPSILDAYLGAALRRPSARVLVGLTQLPPPATLMQEALAASWVTFFFDIARRLPHPPWAVTANVCVPGRGNNAVWFSEQYPKTGGGEDVDFCMRLKERTWEGPGCGTTKEELISSVPEAVALHPFWAAPLRQVAGWAAGDVLCLGALPHAAFRAPPNWAEALLLLSLLAASAAAGGGAAAVAAAAPRLAAAAAWVVVIEVLFSLATYAPRTPKGAPWPRRLAVAALAGLPAAVQDVVRLRYKICNLRPLQLMLCFDWLAGQGGHVAAARLALTTRCVAWAAAAPALLGCSAPRVAAAGAVAAASLAAFSRAQRVDPKLLRRRDYLGSLPRLPLPAGGPAPFVILAYQRTGSNLLAGLLHNHPEIIMHNEIFTYNPDLLSPAAGWHWDVFSRDADPQRFLAELLAHVHPAAGAGGAGCGCTPPAAGVGGTGGGGCDRGGSCAGGGGGGPAARRRAAKAIGFKLFPEHWHGPQRTQAFHRLLADPAVKKVVLRRTNVLDVYASKLRADKTGAYIGRPLDGVPLAIDPAAFQGFADHYSAAYDYYDSLLMGQGAASVTRVTYGELAGADGGAAAFARLCRFLGVDAAPPAWPLAVTVRQTRAPLSEGITNYEDLRYAFKCTPLADCFVG